MTDTTEGKRLYVPMRVLRESDWAVAGSALPVRYPPGVVGVLLVYGSYDEALFDWTNVPIRAIEPTPPRPPVVVGLDTPSTASSPKPRTRNVNTPRKVSAARKRPKRNA